MNVNHSVRRDAAAVVGLDNADTGYATCAGEAVTYGRRCRRIVASWKTQDALAYVEKLADRATASLAVTSAADYNDYEEGLLRKAASSLLCWQHQGQCDTLVAKWKRKLGQLASERRGSRGGRRERARRYGPDRTSPDDDDDDDDDDDGDDELAREKLQRQREWATMRERQREAWEREKEKSKRERQWRAFETECLKVRAKFDFEWSEQLEKNEKKKKEKEERERKEKEEEERRKQEEKEKEEREKQKQKQKEKEEREREKQREKEERERQRQRAKEERERKRREAEEAQARAWAAAWKRYSDGWERIERRVRDGEAGLITLDQIAWPVKSGRWEDVTERSVRAFFTAAATASATTSGTTKVAPAPAAAAAAADEGEEAERERRFRLASRETVRWHTDKMQSLFGKEVLRGQRGEAIRAVSRVVIVLRQEAQARRRSS